MARHTRGSERWGVGTGLVRTKELVGAHVANRAGDELGRIEEVVLDTVRGCISYAVLSFHESLGLGNKLFAIPWQALQVDPERRLLVLDASQETLRNAPGFDRDNWPDMADPAWQSRIHGYYGYEPIQPRRGADVEAGTTVTDIESRTTVGLAGSVTVDDVTGEIVQTQLHEGHTITDLEAREDVGPEESSQDEAEGRRRRAA